ncbi:Uncharacterised protein [[Clostridium] sordellii]|uniref:hypothetical protein n=1 Tax=Paraclostridium sordellii TaxID=1505 RepID=UPI0005E7BFD4|nr:hypothetical protein [Paeniclostridium sordellii]CEQ11371.1 Uncharacterised protein [[Clostridium] sordellii] [Paeniclostridium sordellii]
MNKKQTGKSISTKASNTLTSSKSSAIQKKLAGSALSQSSTKKQTSKEMEKVASKALKSKKSNLLTKELAGSVLAQSNKKR